MIGDLLGAYLTGAGVGLLAGAMGALFLGLHLLDQVDRATTLPGPADEPPTERLSRLVDVIDLPRRTTHSRSWSA